MYISNNEIGGPILTTDPVFSAHSNELFIQFYNNVTDAIDIYNDNIENVNAVVYYNEFYPCIGEGCEQLKKELFNNIYSENSLIYNQTFYGSHKYIFIRNLN